MLYCNQPFSAASPVHFLRRQETLFLCSWGTPAAGGLQLISRALLRFADPSQLL
nr:MAG TPA: hypothetical protein [Caudoviricetes sp.]